MAFGSLRRTEIRTSNMVLVTGQFSYVILGTRWNLLSQTVVTGHPVRKDVVYGGGFNQTGASSTQQEWAALPEEICIDAVVHSNWIASPIGAACRIFIPQIDPIVTARSQKP